MKENENKKTVVRITQGSPEGTATVQNDSARAKMEKFKKPLIFVLMGVVFVGCLYLIFKPSFGEKEIENIGLNETVPQATGTNLPANKSKAYEKMMRKKKIREKRNAMMSLSDYWKSEVKKETAETSPEKEGTAEHDTPPQSKSTPTLDSYRYAQNTLSSFYENNDQETAALKKQIAELKEQLEKKEEPRPHTVEDQLALMEKSYEMATKYFPSNTLNNQGMEPIAAKGGAPVSPSAQQEYFAAFTPALKNPVSTLYREPSDSTFINNWSEDRNRAFYTVGSSVRLVKPKNSIKACVHETQTVIGETRVRLRLLEHAKTPNHIIPKGTVLTANAKFQGGRLQLKVTSIELEGNIIPVNISIYDLDGQQGLYVPYSPEVNALSEMAGNMGQTSGTSLMLTQSAGQQVAADLSRGIVQGISGYFSKKVKTPKVTLKAGYQVFLVSKN